MSHVGSETPCRILLLSGPVAVGKSSISEQLVKSIYFERIRSGKFLMERAMDFGLPTDRRGLQAIGDELDIQTDYRWIVDDVALPTIAGRPEQRLWLVDAVRKTRQIEHFRAAFPGAVVHIHLTADENLLAERYGARILTGGEYFGQTSYKDAILHPNEISSRGLGSVADLIIDVGARTPREVADGLMASLASVAAR